LTRQKKKGIQVIVVSTNRSSMWFPIYFLEQPRQSCKLFHHQAQAHRKQRRPHRTHFLRCLVSREEEKRSWTSLHGVWRPVKLGCSGRQSSVFDSFEKATGVSYDGDARMGITNKHTRLQACQRLILDSSPFSSSPVLYSLRF
jgi:hypothetical protein